MPLLDNRLCQPVTVSMAGRKLEPERNRASRMPSDGWKSEGDSYRAELPSGTVLRLATPSA